MKTLIINGSPRIQGDTESLIHIVRNGITGELLDVGSRLQTYFCARFF